MKQFWLGDTHSHTHVTALRVALVVGSILFILNHGGALVMKRMNHTRWISGVLTYCVPYCVSLHGQCQGSNKGNHD